MNVYNPYSEERQHYVAEINTLIEHCHFPEAIAACKHILGQTMFNMEDGEDRYFHAEIVGLLVDAGSLGRSRNAVEQAIRSMETYEKQYRAVIAEGSYWYNLANGYSALSDLEFPTSPHFLRLDADIVKGSLFKAKSIYFSAYKALKNKEDGELYVQCLVNLANHLSRNHRIIEALQWFDIASRQMPGYPYTLYNRAEKLEFLSTLLGSYSVNMRYQIAKNYKEALKHLDFLTPELRQTTFKKLDYYTEWLHNKGYTEKLFGKEEDETLLESKNHTPYRQFCLKHYLSLNEHALYCDCAASATDNLQITCEVRAIGGDFVPQMSALLNRIKAEFCFARNLFYQAEKRDRYEDNEEDKEIDYAELCDDALLSTRIEMMRTSYRLSYGVLDKIAIGICTLFKAENKEVGFDNFWKKRGQEKRWSLLCEKSEQNPWLLPLYSIAYDLNTNSQSSGAWKNLKELRNGLEHGFVSVVERLPPTDVFEIYKDSNFISFVISEQEFRDQTLYLLQLCRAAIFYFTFCVRREGELLVLEDDSSKHGTMALLKKMFL